MRAGSGPFRLHGDGERHRPNCLCCIGPPDHAFERACAAVANLALPGVGAAEAEKFVRLCCASGGGDAEPLSKSKRKLARRTIRARGLDALEEDDVTRMEAAALAAFRGVPGE